MSVERKFYGITYYLIENTLKKPKKILFQAPKSYVNFWLALSLRDRDYEETFLKLLFWANI